MPSLLEGIEAKYGSDSDDYELDIPILYVTRSTAVPPVLVFNDFGIDSAGSEESLKTKCQNVQELDLAQNSLSQWTEVMTILRIMPRLKFANLNNNVSSWREISKLGQAFPNLESVILADCPITSLEVASPPSSLETSPRYMRCESECEGSSRSVESPHHWFRNLKFLNLNNTLLSSWEDIDRLACFPSLEHLRLHGLPLFTEHCQGFTKHERRQLLVARLPNIRTLNGGGEISHDDREDAERAFIRHYMDKPESDWPERYSDLVSLHGKLDPLVNVDLSPEKFVTVTVIHGNKSESQCLDVYKTVTELKQKLEPIVHIAVPKMRLFYADQDFKESHGPEEMIYPNKRLYSYYIKSGDEIIVDSKV
ncbi:unnamed protein product [Nesidiocoris tenuis]|uniref:Leucine-rich repeat-containing protein 51 n=1 Tax=Nesidiocoris tenuis TaxID=355587 RepID=A0A6H5GE59_9HEMI|nr:unnamed protein product [Nesidiocoris tenuis]